MSYLDLFTAVLWYSQDDAYGDRMINTKKKKKRRGC